MGDENISHNSPQTVSRNKDLGTLDVVLGKQLCRTQDAKWLCLENIYIKLHRPHFYDIGGTYIEDVADYWFYFKTEQVGSIFLLHLFFSNHSDGFCAIAVSSGNILKFDKRKPTAYLPSSVKEYQFKKVKQFTQNYITTYNFSELDVEFLKDRSLYISVSFPHAKVECISQEIVDNLKVNHDCGALLEDPVGSDFTIESADGVKFPVHKVLLAAHSEVFKAMLKDETAESQNGFVKLCDDERDLRWMIEYIYTGKLKEVENVNFLHLLILADRYNLKGLIELSQHALSEQLTLDNAIDILIIADMHDNSDVLKKSALKFIKKNINLIDTSVFKELNNMDLVKEIFTYLKT